VHRKRRRARGALHLVRLEDDEGKNCGNAPDARILRDEHGDVAAGEIPLFVIGGDERRFHIGKVGAGGAGTTGGESAQGGHEHEGAQGRMGSLHGEKLDATVGGVRSVVGGALPPEAVRSGTAFSVKKSRR